MILRSLSALLLFFPLATTQAQDLSQGADSPWSAYWVESPDSEALCRGGYILPEESPNEDEAWMTLSGTELEYLPEEGADISGGVRVQFGQRRFEAERVTAPKGMSHLRFEGQVRYFEPGAVVWGERADYEASTESVRLESLQFLLHDQVFSGEVVDSLPPFRGQAKHITLSEGLALVEDAWFTRCEPDSSGWIVSSKQLRMDKSDAFATVTHARLSVADVPVLYVPWMKFPVTAARQTGWLYPDLRYEGERGGVIRLPFYWNIAPNRDLVVIPGFEGRRGASFGFEYRHLTPNSSNRMIAHLLSDDEEFKDDFPDENGSRYLVRANHRAKFGRIVTMANLTLLSDRRMHRERYDELGSSHTRWGGPSVTNEGHIVYQHDNWQVGVEMEQYRIDWNPNPDAYKTAPSVFFNGEKRFASGLRSSFHTSWSRFTNDITERDFGEVTRWSNDLLMKYPMQKAWGGVTASFGGAYVAFELQEARRGQTAWVDEVNSRSGSGFVELDGSLKFERRFENMRMSLEPRAFYTYRQSDELLEVPLFDSVLDEFTARNVFSGRSYVGTDRYADIHQIALGVRSRLWNLRTGRRLLEVEAGVIRSLQGDGILFKRLTPDQETSPLALRARSWLSEQVRIETSLVWQHDEDRWFERGLWASYRTPEALVLRLGYRMRRYGEVFEQAEAAIDLPISERLRLFGIYSYDFSRDRLLAGVVGASYTHCCWRIDLGVRRLLRRPNNTLAVPPYHSNAVYLSILFRGFAGVGDSIDPLLSAIKGQRYGW